jgi:hypothetical protein
MGKRNLNKINKRKIKNKRNKSYKYILLIAILILFSILVLFILKYFLFSSIYAPISGESSSVKINEISSIYAPISGESSPVKISEINVTADINCKTCQDNGMLNLNTEKDHYLLYGFNKNKNKYFLNYDGREVYVSPVDVLAYSQLSSDGSHYFYLTYNDISVNVYLDGEEFKTIPYPYERSSKSTHSNNALPLKYINNIKIMDSGKVIYVLHDHSNSKGIRSWSLMKDNKKMYERDNLKNEKFMESPLSDDIQIDKNGENFLIKTRLYSSFSALKMGDELPTEMAVYNGKIVNQYKPLPNSACCNNFQISPNGKHYKITVFAEGNTLVDGKVYNMAGNCHITNSGKLYCISSSYNGGKLQIFVNNALFKTVDNFPKAYSGIALNEDASHSIVSYVLSKYPNGSRYLIVDGKKIDTAIDFQYARISGDNIYMYNYQFMQ